MAKKSIGIDIGLNSIKIVELTKDHRGAIRVTHAAVKYIGMDWETNDEHRADIFIRYLKKIREVHKIAKKRGVIISLPSLSVFVRYLELLDARRSREHELIRMEAEQQIPLSLEEVAWDYMLVDESRNEKSAILMAVKKESVDSSITVTEQAGFNAQAVTLNLLCVLKLIKKQRRFNTAEGIIVIDIGADGTGVLINHGKHIWLRNVSLAGRKITESIMNTAGVDAQTAEKIKCEGPHAAEEMDEPSQQAVRDAMAVNVNNLAAEIERSISFYKQERKRSDESFDEETFNSFVVVITGGGSKVDGIEEFFSEKLKLSVEKLNTFASVNIQQSVLRKNQLDGINYDEDVIEEINPLFAVAVGAAMYGFERHGCDINFLKKDIHEHRSVQVAGCLRIAAYLLFFAAFVVHFYLQHEEIQFNKTQLRELEQYSDNVDSFGPQLTKINRNIDVLNERGVFLLNYMQKRTLWYEVIQGVAEALPGDVWLTNIQGNGFLETGKDNEFIVQGMTTSYDRLNDFITALKQVDRFNSVKPESVLTQKDSFSFLLNIAVANTHIKREKN